MKRFLLFFLLWLFPEMASAGAEIDFSGRMTDISPGVRRHLLTVLENFPRTPTGKFILARILPGLRFAARAMAPRGTADRNDVVTLEALRLDNKNFPETTPRQHRIKECFTAEIMAHELLHNAQFRAGLADYPADFSGYAAVLGEMLMELQAKYTGETMFAEMRALPEYCADVAPKAGFYLFSLRNTDAPETEYYLTLWRNLRVTPRGVKLFRDQIREVSTWNRYYAEQAFRNNFFRFRSDQRVTPPEKIAAFLEKIIDFTGMKIDARDLVCTAAVRPIPHGIACFENGKLVLEFIAEADGYRKKIYAGKTVREVKFLFPHAP